MGTIISFAKVRARPGGDSARRAKAIADFLQDQTNEGRSNRTVEQHRKELRRYCAWLDTQEFDWQLVLPSDCAAYARTRSHRGASSRASLITTMKVFYAWASDPAHGPLVARNPTSSLHAPKRPKAVPKSLSSNQVKILFKALADESEREDSPRNRRDRVLILTGLYTGMRAAELAALIWPDLDLISGVAIVRKGKGDKGRSIKLRPEIIEILSLWRVLQKGSGDGPVFSLDGHPIQPSRVGKIVRHYQALTRLPLTAHVLRHTFATMALRKSGNLYSVSKALGHAQLQQTMIYLRADPSDTDPAIDSLPGFDDW